MIRSTIVGSAGEQARRSSQAIVELRKAVQINPHNVRAIYLLAQEVERQADANGEAEFQQLLERILAEQPGNPAALLELGRVAAKRGEAQTLRSVVAQLSAQCRDLAPGSATAVERFAGCGCWPRSASMPPFALHFSQLADAHARLSPEPWRDTTHCGERSHAVQSFPAPVLANLSPAPADTAITSRPLE